MNPFFRNDADMPPDAILKTELVDVTTGKRYPIGRAKRRSRSAAVASRAVSRAQPQDEDPSPRESVHATETTRVHFGVPGLLLALGGETGFVLVLRSHPALMAPIYGAIIFLTLLVVGICMTAHAWPALAGENQHVGHRQVSSD